MILLDCGHESEYDGFQVEDFRENGKVYEICEELCNNIEGINHNGANTPTFKDEQSQNNALNVDAVEVNDFLWNRQETK